ncbi:uncharacterized protein PADG_03358 [Paracoccidioides brasiliensis Pb18]|uniref:Uncharacterized protein n=1 Tax=Paracoccidioides brasiliensis (strain Pb18) TaxID=502780 RepID=C1G853_PARBD|nr:uncharacterized protein PADG_03358 [Paracoccidioides brasiliensis Pb18]EEH47260.2 hypothetical protein PADG_03358 [Paracoccidioides brasiliensis Pb18]
MASPVHYHYCGHNRQQTSPSVFWDWDRSDGDTRGARFSFINRNEGVTRGFRNSLHVKPTDSGKKPNFEAFSGFHTSVEEEEPGTEIFSTKWGPLVFDFETHLRAKPRRWHWTCRLQLSSTQL